jgi:C-terminal processing protease CtpA/Prc
VDFDGGGETDEDDEDEDEDDDDGYVTSDEEEETKEDAQVQSQAGGAAKGGGLGGLFGTRQRSYTHTDDNNSHQATPSADTNEMSMWSRAMSSSPRQSPGGGKYFSTTFSNQTLGLFFRDEGGKIWVSDVERDGIAAASGVQLGDEVLRLNGTPISSAQDLALLVRQLPRPLELAFRRG